MLLHKYIHHTLLPASNLQKRFVGFPNPRQVDKDFTIHQARIKDLGAAIDHLAISAEKYQLEVLHFFAKQEEAEKFSPLARAAAGV